MSRFRLPRHLWAAYNGFSRHDGPLVAAGIAYYVALSFFPLLLVLAAGLAYGLQWTAKGQDAQQWILSAIEQQASPALAESVKSALDTAGARAPATGSIGFAVLVVTAVAIFAQVDYAFERIWDRAQRPDEGWLQWIGRHVFYRFKALAVLMGVGAFIIVVMVAAVVWSGVQARVASRIEIAPWLTWTAGLLLNMTLNFFAFSAVYRFLPKVKVRWLEAFDGAIVASTLWEVGRQALALYLVRQDYPTAYGIIGSFLAIMLWAYYAMIVVLFGAEVVRAIQQERLAAAKELRDARRESRAGADSLGG
jgi:membrane protein